MADLKTIFVFVGWWGELPPGMVLPCQQGASIRWMGLRHTHASAERQLAATAVGRVRTLKGSASVGGAWNVYHCEAIAGADPEVGRHRVAFLGRARWSVQLRPAPGMPLVETSFPRPIWVRRGISIVKCVPLFRLSGVLFCTRCMCMCVCELKCPLAEQCIFPAALENSSQLISLIQNGVGECRLTMHAYGLHSTGRAESTLG